MQNCLANIHVFSMNVSAGTSHFPHELNEILKGVNFVFIIKTVKTEKELDMFRLWTNQRQLLNELVSLKFFDYGISQDITMPFQTFILIVAFMIMSFLLLFILICFITRRALYNCCKNLKRICFEEVEDVESKDAENEFSDVENFESRNSYKHYDSEFGFSEDERDDGFDEYFQKAKNHQRSDFDMRISI